MRLLWGRRSRDLSEVQDRVLSNEDSPSDSKVEKHERDDYRTRRMRSEHPIRRAFGITPVLSHPRTLTGPGMQIIGRCTINGREVRFTYYLPFYRLVLDMLAPDTVVEQAQREAWCREHNLEYWYTNPGETFDFMEIARTLKERT